MSRERELIDNILSQVEAANLTGESVYVHPNVMAREAAEQRAKAERENKPQGDPTAPPATGMPTPIEKQTPRGNPNAPELFDAEAAVAKIDRYGSWSEPDGSRTGPFGFW